MANLLEEASILLTPTAYNDGSMLAVKPENGDGDFTFSRNSAATRVNAQGLVENVQILSSNLVSNGDFSQEGAEEVSNGSFSQEGSEVSVNGDFALNSNWSGANTISNGQLTKGSGGGLVYQGTLDGTIKSYKVVVDVAEKNGVSLNLYLGGNQFALNEGVQTLYIQSGSSNTFLGFNNGADSVINSISVKEVGQDWILTSGASISNDKLNVNANAYDYFARQLNVSTIGKTYKVSVDVEIQSGRVILYLADTGAFEVIDTSGSYTFYIVADGTQIRFRAFDTAFIGSITNISVKEVGQNWSLGTGWSIGDSEVNAVNAPFGSQLVDSATLTASKKYSVSFVISNYIQGVVRVAVGNVFSSDVSADGSYTFILTSANTNAFKVQARGGGSGTTLSIDNVSVIEITDDTNLPRINYEGFSYQDSLGSELVAGANSGNISTSSVYTNIYTNASIVNGKIYAVTFTAQDLENTIQSWSWTNYAPVDSSILYSNGTNTAYVNATVSGNLNLRFYSPSGRTGTLSDISIKEYLGQEVVPNSGCGSWLLEPQSTNLITQSEDFSNSYWRKDKLTVTSNSINSPSGEVNASLIQETVYTSSIPSIDLNSSISLTAGSYTCSFYVKRNNVRYLGINFGSSAERIRTNFDFDTLTFKTPIFNGSTTGELSYTALGDYYRISVNANFPSTISGDINIIPLATDTYPFYANQNSDNRSFYLWGAQLEAQSFPTSYIPTQGAISTRLQDIATNSGNASLINSESGVLYAEILKPSNNEDFRIISLSGSSANFINIGFNSDSKFWFNIKSNNANSFIDQSVNANQNQYYKVALKYKSGDIAVWINGLEILNSQNIFTFTVNLDSLDFMFNKASNLYNFYGNTKALAVFKTALTDEQLTALTTI